MKFLLSFGLAGGLLCASRYFYAASRERDASLNAIYWYGASSRKRRRSLIIDIDSLGLAPPSDRCGGDD